ncbi:MAG: alginate export family protein, partial [Verrucomicrobia bacterium]|nr:alginate export family protein [Verrucomicrobiota bacterium]
IHVARCDRGILLPADHWQYSLEGAYQFGRKQDATVAASYVNSSTDWRDISAYGGKAKLTYLCKDKLNNQFSLMGEFLSGDDPKTKDKDEMFDVLWGRWPRWSELYIYSYAPETSGKVAQMNNILRFGPGWMFTPMKGMTFSATYNAMFAPEETPTRRVAPAAGLFSYDGNFRGHYLQTVLKHQFNKHLSAHLWAEFVWEGDYYAQRDVMMFIRPEIMFTF